MGPDWCNPDVLTPPLRLLPPIALALLLTAVAACGDDDDEGGTAADDATTSTAEETTTTEGPEVIEVQAVDYAFQGLPASVAVGTKLTLTNGSTKELHELVAIRLPDDEERSAEELVGLPPEEQASLSQGPPAMVLIAPPAGADQIAALGDGTLSQPGRYLVLCSIPTGADPAAYLEAAAQSQGGPPDVEGGPPHLAQGMFGEVVVE